MSDGIGKKVKNFFSVSPSTPTPKFEEVAKELEQKWANMKNRETMQPILAEVLNSPLATELLFKEARQRVDSDVQQTIKTMRETNDPERAKEMLSIFMTDWQTLFVGTLAEALNARISEQRRALAQIADALGKDDATLKALGQKLAEAPVLTKEQAEALSAFKKALDEMAAADKRGQAPYV